jgi:hypothetical protein
LNFPSDGEVKPRFVQSPICGHISIIYGNLDVFIWDLARTLIFPYISRFFSWDHSPIGIWWHARFRNISFSQRPHLNCKHPVEASRFRFNIKHPGETIWWRPSATVKKRTLISISRVSTCDKSTLSKDDWLDISQNSPERAPLSHAEFFRTNMVPVSWFLPWNRFWKREL